MKSVFLYTMRIITLILIFLMLIILILIILILIFVPGGCMQALIQSVITKGTFTYCVYTLANFVSWWMWFNGTPTKAPRNFLTNACILLPSYVYNMQPNTKSARLIAVCKRSLSFNLLIPPCFCIILVG